MEKRQDADSPEIFSPDEGSSYQGLVVMLSALEGPEQGRHFPIRRKKTVVGRKNADITIDDPTVSGKHAVFELEGKKLFITDNKSTNGVELNGEAIESRQLKDNDQVKLGDTVLRVSIRDEAAAGSEEASGPSQGKGREDRMSLPRPVYNPEVQENIHMVLEVMEGPDKGKKHKVYRRSTIIGSDPSAEITIKHESVFPRHCELDIRNKDQMVLKDRPSSSGTRLNDSYISEVKIRHGDVIQIGEVKMKILIHIRK